MMRRSISTVVLILLCLCSLTTTMPHIQSSIPQDIDIESSWKQLKMLFDDLLMQDADRARSALDYSMKALFNPTSIHTSSPTKYERSRRQHIDDCNNAVEHIQRGFRGFYILQSRLADHLCLLMSIVKENQLIMRLMYSIYLHDIGAVIDDYQAHLLSDDEHATTLLQHANHMKYENWQEFLWFVNADDEDEDEEDIF